MWARRPTATPGRSSATSPRVSCSSLEGEEPRAIEAGLPPGPRPTMTPRAAPISIYASEAEIGGVPPQSLADRQYHRARWTVLPRGGHFMATEEPDLLAADIRAFAANL